MASWGHYNPDRFFWIKKWLIEATLSDNQPANTPSLSQTTKLKAKFKLS